MATPLAQVADLQSWLGIGTLDEDRATAVLTAASALARVEAGRTWLNEDGDVVGVPEDVSMIVVRVAAQMWANPSGASQQATGPFSVSYARNFLSEEDRRTLNGYRGRPGLWTQSTTRGELETEPVYVDVVGSDEPLPVSIPPW